MFPVWPNQGLSRRHFAFGQYTNNGIELSFVMLKLFIKAIMVSVVF